MKLREVGKEVKRVVEKKNKAVIQKVIVEPIIKKRMEKAKEDIQSS